MRVYEYARSRGLTSWQVLDALRSQSPQYRYLVAASSLSDDMVRTAERVLGTVAVAKSAAPAPELISRSEVQGVIDEIVREYGTDWCDNGRNDASERLKRLGLSLAPKMDVRVDLQVWLKDAPYVDGDGLLDESLFIAEVRRRLSEPFVINGATYTVSRTNDRYGNTEAVVVNDYYLP